MKCLAHPPQLLGDAETEAHGWTSLRDAANPGEREEIRVVVSRSQAPPLVPD